MLYLNMIKYKDNYVFKTLLKVQLLTNIDDIILITNMYLTFK